MPLTKIPSSGLSGNLTLGNVTITGTLFDSNGLPYSVGGGGGGSTGFTGSIGTTGFTGSQGNVGFTGSTGSTGSTGFTGSQGNIGFSGSTGFTGSAGTGFTGSSGTVGFTGSAGVGFTGSAGGSSFTTGNTKPASAQVGQFWFDTDTDVLYQYMNVGTATHWIDVSGQSYNFGVSQSTQTAIAESTNVTPTIEYLVVGGGGGGAASASVVGTGGGGAGGYLTGNLSPVIGATYVITVGAGGALAAGGTDLGNSGSNSSFGNTIVAYGGGRGGFWGTGGNGGSGGGSGGNGPAAKGVYPGSTYISAPRQGYDGGVGSGVVGSGLTSGGGGGGAGGPGGNSASNSIQALGGLGIYNTITGANVYYASGGSGGIGTGGATPVASRFAGNVNTGGGGAGGTYAAGQQDGLAGGSGVVVLRYPSSYADPLAITGSPTVTTANGYKVYVFTSSGTITI